MNTAEAEPPITVAPPLPVQTALTETELKSIEVVVPVYNEQLSLGPSIHRLHEYLRENIAQPFTITIADNASTDDTLAIAHDLEQMFEQVQVRHLDRKGRGAALQMAWGQSCADVLVYMDVDLSTDLSALLPLIAPLLSGHSDIAIGSRLARGARVARGSKREIISRCYNLLLRTSLGVRFSDAQCGFKAITAKAARQLLPLVQDKGWFFDTELLVLAERSGMRIYEVPVDWIDDPDSRVDIVHTAWTDLKGIARLLRAFGRGEVPLDQVRAALGTEPLQAPPEVGNRLMRQAIRFGAIGVLSTLAYLALFVMLSPLVGAQPANFVALLLTAIANTAANRRFTFGISGSQNLMRHHWQGVLVFAIALALTSASLAIYHQTGIVSQGLELTVLVVANLVATLMRFVVLKRWVFRR